MGPRRIRRGERRFNWTETRLECLLQWGDGKSAVENQAIEEPFVALRMASMGPRRIRRGERHRHRQRGASLRGFNGATANSPWRTLPAATSPPSSTLLQWGHGEFAVENLSATFF